MRTVVPSVSWGSMDSGTVTVGIRRLEPGSCPYVHGLGTAQQWALRAVEPGDRDNPARTDPGSHTVTVRAVDSSGRASGVGNTATVTVDPFCEL